MSKTIIIIGGALIVIGLLWPWLVKFPWGRLPGDLVIRRDNFHFYFPVTTSILVSLVLTLLFWLFRR